jgi:hypothetical protein
LFMSRAKMKRYALKLFKEAMRLLVTKVIKLLRTSSSSSFKPSS